MTKLEILTAISTLSGNYARGNVKHGFNTCPLCLLYDMNNCKKDDTACNKCPNIVFKKPSLFPCISRILDYSQLDWCESTNNKNLSNFWNAVYLFLKDLNEEDVVDMSYLVQLGILNIAKHYNK